MDADRPTEGQTKCTTDRRSEMGWEGGRDGIHVLGLPDRMT